MLVFDQSKSVCFSDFSIASVFVWIVFILIRWVDILPSMQRLLRNKNFRINIVVFLSFFLSFCVFISLYLCIYFIFLHQFIHIYKGFWFFLHVYICLCMFECVYMYVFINRSVRNVHFWNSFSHTYKFTRMHLPQKFLSVSLIHSYQFRVAAILVAANANTVDLFENQIMPLPFLQEPLQ